jgi:large-conductance mechanosensitive channel
MRGNVLDMAIGVIIGGAFSILLARVTCCAAHRLADGKVVSSLFINLSVHRNPR